MLELNKHNFFTLDAGKYRKSTGLALFWKKKNLYIFTSNKGSAGYRLGYKIQMRKNTDGKFKSKPIIYFSLHFIIFSIELGIFYDYRISHWSKRPLASSRLVGEFSNHVECTDFSQHLLNFWYQLILCFLK